MKLREERGLGPVTGTELMEDPAEVIAHCLLTDPQHLSDLLVGLARRDG